MSLTSAACFADGEKNTYKHTFPLLIYFCLLFLTKCTNIFSFPGLRVGG